LLGPDVITQTVKKVEIIHKHLRWLRTDKRVGHLKRRPMEFTVGDYAFLKISPTRGVIRFGS